MKDERARRTHAVFTEAIALPEEERAAFVSSSCGDDAALLTQVTRLIAAASRSKGFLESPALSGTPEAWIPDSVASYLVVGVLGVGGMATVYEAVQENPSRRVALKVLHQGMAHTDAYLRFRLETETLARLHHPGIAQIYEAGTARLGHPSPSPFFAMELVPEAVPITEYARQRRLDPRERLAMFADVCDAVEHGHQLGVIHRDIKPGNVLVGPHGRAKVIDFGIARHTDQGGRPATADADTRRIIGTLAAMSPEQCTTPGDVDVRTDVYSLGVMLYELVTDRRPHDLSGCSIPESVRIICEREPAPAGALCHSARGDLEAIISKAMDKDRVRRYAGAGALAADVRRYLDHRPIEARRATTLEQARKFARRNPPLAGALAAVVLSLVVGLVVSAWFAVEARRARDRALEREKELEVVTAFQESLLRGIRVDVMGAGLRESLLAAAPNPDELERLIEPVNFTALAAKAIDAQILRPARAAIGTQFAAQPLLRARLLHQLADTMNSLGSHADSEPLLREALAIRRNELGNEHVDTLQSVHALASLLSTLGKLDESLSLAKEASDARTRLFGAEDRLSLRYAGTLAGVHRRRAELDEAERIWSKNLEVQRRVFGSDDRETLRTINNVAIVYASQGRLEQAEACFRELVERRRRIFGAESPEYRSSLGNLGVVLQDLGRLADARPLLEEALAADRRRHGDTHSDTLTSMAQLVGLLEEMHELESAEKLARECADGRRATLGPDHADTLRSQVTLASILHQRGSTGPANALMTEAIERQRRTLGNEHPDIVIARHTASGMAQREGRTADALALAEEALRGARVSLTKDPAFMARVVSHAGELTSLDARFEAALELLNEAYDTARRALGDAHPATLECASRLADFFDAAESREPGKGHAATALAWRTRSAPKPR